MSQNESTPPKLTEDLVGAPLIKTAALIAAAQLGFFKVLADGPRSVLEIAISTGASELGVARLTEFLVAVDYLERAGDRYANGPIARTWRMRYGTVGRIRRPTISWRNTRRMPGYFPST